MHDWSSYSFQDKKCFFCTSTEHISQMYIIVGFWFLMTNKKIQAVELDHFCKILLIGYPYCTDNPFSFQDKNCLVWSSIVHICKMYIYAKCTNYLYIMVNLREKCQLLNFFFIILHTGWIICSDNFLSFQDRIFLHFNYRNMHHIHVHV